MDWSILSLFSGAGGMDLGFRLAGFEPRLAIDVDADALRSYRRNHPTVRVEQRDLGTATAEEIATIWNGTTDHPIAGIIGGPPCQAFSGGNVHVRSDDSRRKLPARYASLISGLSRHYGLSFFVFENVIGFRERRNRLEHDEFSDACVKAGFGVAEFVLDAKHFGVPQRRPRLFIVGVSKVLHPFGEIQLPEPPLPFRARTVRDAIGGLPEPARWEHGLKPEAIPHHPNHWTMRPKSKKFANPSLLKKNLWIRRSFRVLEWDAPSWTVAYGNREVHLHPDGHRRLSVLEAMLLQGLPPSYVLEGTLSAQIRQVADVVPPPLAAAVANAVRICVMEQPTSGPAR